MRIARSRAATAFAAGGLAAAALLTACTSGGHPRADDVSSGHLPPGHTHVAQFLPPSTAPAAPTTPAATTPAATGPTQPAAAGPGACSTGDLRLSVGAANGAAGSIYYPLLLANISGASCTLYGYPGVALVNQPGGVVIGAPAVRNPTFPATVVTVRPDAVAHASLQVAIAANYPAAQCKPATAHWLQVFPPGEYAALYVAFTAQTCTSKVGDGSTLGIYVVRPGVTGP